MRRSVVFSVAVQSDRAYENFVANNFDSEESVMIVLALRRRHDVVPIGKLVDDLIREYGLSQEEPRRLTEKRIELRSRDLVAAGLVEQVNGDFMYRQDDAIEGFLRRVAADFVARRSELSRLIYSTTGRARRLAEAFRL